MTDFIKQAAHVKPNERQLKLLCETPFYAFIHFGPNSCTQSELCSGKDAAEITFSCREENETQKAFDICFKEKQTVRFIEIKEDIKEGQRAENFFVYKINEYSGEEPVFEGTTIGSCKIIKTSPFEAGHLRIFIASSRDVPLISKISVY